MLAEEKVKNFWKIFCVLNPQSIQQAWSCLHSPLTPIDLHFPVQMTLVAVLNLLQVAETVFPGTIVVPPIVNCTPLLAKQTRFVTVWEPLFVTRTAFAVTETTSGYVPIQAVWFSDTDETPAPIVLVKPVIQTLMSPPIATVKAMSRIVATIGLIALLFIMKIYFLEI